MSELSMRQKERLELALTAAGMGREAAALYAEAIAPTVAAMIGYDVGHCACGHARDEHDAGMASCGMCPCEEWSPSRLSP